MFCFSEQIIEQTILQHMLSLKMRTKLELYLGVYSEGVPQWRPEVENEEPRRSVPYLRQGQGPGPS